MRKIKCLFYYLVAFAAVLQFVACDNKTDDRNDDAGSLLKLPKERVFILNEGSFEANNTTVDLYLPNGTTDKNEKFVGSVFEVQNSVKLGDTGMSMVEEDDAIFVSVYGSSLLVKTNKAGVLLDTIKFSQADGQPRYLVAENDKIYVSLYSGKVARVNAKTMKIEAYVIVGNNPEQMVEEDNYLYVVNSGWGSDSTLSVVNLKTFNVEKTINVAVNPFQIEEANDKIFVISYGASYNYPLQCVDIAKGTVEELGTATIMAADDNTLYLANSTTDWSTYTTTTTLFTYDALSGKINNESFVKLEGKAAAIATSSVTMLEVNSDNGEIYIGTSDYVTNGTVYRFAKNGSLLEVIECSSLTPNTAIFVD